VLALGSDAQGSFNVGTGVETDVKRHLPFGCGGGAVQRASGVRTAPTG